MIYERSYFAATPHAHKNDTCACSDAAHMVWVYAAGAQINYETRFYVLVMFYNTVQCTWRSFWTWVR